MGLLESLFPGWAARRLEARSRLRLAQFAARKIDRFVGYPDATPSRLDPAIQARGAAPDWAAELGFDRREIVDRAQQMERSNALACTLLDRAVQHVVGEGFVFKAKTKDPGWNAAAEEIWRDWSTKCDARGILTFGQILQTVYRSWLRDGDVGCLLEQDGTVRIVESNEIASAQGGYTRPSDADGVELDARGRITGFWVFDYDPKILWPDRRRALPRLVKVPAESMIFLARRQRAGQTRGISAFTGICWLLEQLDELLEAVVTAHRMAACVGLLLKKKSPLSGVQLATAADGTTQRPNITFEPAMVARIDPDEDAQQIDPKHPGANFEILADALIRFAAARFDLSIEVANFNFSKTNYSNARAGDLEVTLAKREKQAMLRGLCREFWGFRLARAIRQKELTPRKDMASHVFNAPSKPWADPNAEVTAALASVDGALDTRSRILARRGLDFDEIVAELADEEQKLEAAGIEIVRGALSRDPTPPPSPVKPAGEKARANGTHRLAF